ncbi:MAG: Bax inhibitor-1 family protein [Pseudomonadales bacterium]
MAEPLGPIVDAGLTIELNKVLRSTYLLLAMAIGFAALTAFVGIVMGLPFMGFWPYLIGFLGLSWAVNKTANSSWGIVMTFVFTGFIGLAMAPILNVYLQVNPGIVVQSLGMTAATFVGLSIYTIFKRTNFSWLGQFLTVAFFIVLGIIITSIFVDLSVFTILISGLMVFIACALILYQTSRIVLGGETNYIIAANNLFVSVYILFMNLLSILGIMGDD